jgi:hypothetical protein
MRDHRHTVGGARRAGATAACRHGSAVQRRDEMSAVPVRVSRMTKIDCDTCVVRGPACHDCVITVLLGPPPELTIDDVEARALEALADGGLVPPLRMVEAVTGPEVESA